MDIARLPIGNSLSRVAESLFTYLSNHPLLYHEVVRHPITGEHVPIDYWRQNEGLVTGGNLVCSIFPSYRNDDTVPMGRQVPSITYNPHTLGGSGADEQATYHFVIRFTYQGEVSFDALNTVERVVELRDPLYPEDLPIYSTDTRTIRYAINPHLSIVSDYLELVRFALYDTEYQNRYRDVYPFPGTNVTVEQVNFSDSPWDQSSNIITQEGSMIVGIDRYASRDWRQYLYMPVSSYKVTINPT